MYLIHIVNVIVSNFIFLLFFIAASYIFGSSGKLMIELCAIGYLMGTCITYFVVVGDLGPQIISKIFNINQTDSLRYCLLFNLYSLQIFSIECYVNAINQ